MWSLERRQTDASDRNGRPFVQDDGLRRPLGRIGHGYARDGRRLQQELQELLQRPHRPCQDRLVPRRERLRPLPAQEADFQAAGDIRSPGGHGGGRKEHRAEEAQCHNRHGERMREVRRADDVRAPVEGSHGPVQAEERGGIRLLAAPVRPVRGHKGQVGPEVRRRRPSGELPVAEAQSVASGDDEIVRNNRRDADA